MERKIIFGYDSPDLAPQFSTTGNPQLLSEKKHEEMLVEDGMPENVAKFLAKQLRRDHPQGEN